MTTESLKAVVFFLNKRKVTFLDKQKTAGFVRLPATEEKVQTAMDTFQLLLSEAESELKLSEEYGGHLADSLPVIYIGN